MDVGYGLGLFPQLDMVGFGIMDVAIMFID